jgi:hypothetical protein
MSPEGPETDEASARVGRFALPQWPARDGTWSDVGTTYGVPEVPPAWRDLRRGVFLRTVVGLTSVWFAFAAFQSVRGEASEASWLLDHVSTEQVVVVNAWYEPDFHAPSTLHAEVQLQDKVAEVDRLKGSPAIGDEISVLVDPRNEQIWEQRAARDAADPGALLAVLGVGLAGCLLFAGWLVARPARLRFRMARSRRLSLFRVHVTDLQEEVEPRGWRRPRRLLPRRLRSLPSVWVDVADARGGNWTLSVPHRVMAFKDSLVGRPATVAMVGRPFRPGRGALLLARGPDDPHGDGGLRVWCTSGPYRRPPSASARS